MERSAVKELHYILPIANLESVLARGILSHSKVAKIKHDSIAMPEIQERRAKIRVPGGGPLHGYANLYFHARNPMMWRRKSSRDTLCVLRVNPDVLDVEGVVIADGNAASSYTQFRRSPQGLAIVDETLTFALDWRSRDLIDYYRRKSAKCAEVLVPERVHPTLIDGCYVCSAVTKASVHAVAPNLGAAIAPDLFFAE